MDRFRLVQFYKVDMFVASPGTTFSAKIPLNFASIIPRTFFFLRKQKTSELQ